MRCSWLPDEVKAGGGSEPQNLQLVEGGRPPAHQGALRPALPDLQVIKHALVVVLQLELIEPGQVPSGATTHLTATRSSGGSRMIHSHSRLSA